MKRQIESKSIRVPKQHLEFMQQLTGRSRYPKSDAPFSTFYDALIFSAVLGFDAKQRELLAPGSGADPILYSTMSSNVQFEALLAIFAVLNSKDDHTCLSGDKADARIEMFEQYACAGLTLLKEAHVGYGGSLRDYVETEVVRELSSISDEFESEEEESSS